MSTAWDTALLPIPPLQGMVKADICVIGLGGSGLAALRHLQRNGVRRLVGLDAGGIASGAAGRNGGFLLAGPACFHHRARERWGASFARDLYDLTLRGMRQMVRETSGPIARTGSVRVAATDAERLDIQAHLEALTADGFAGERWSGPEGDGLRIPDDAVFQPQERCDQLAEQAWDDGAWLYGDSPALEITAERVRTPRGEVQCEAVLVCVDGGLDRLLPELADRVDTRRLQMLGTAPAKLGRYTGAYYYRDGLDYWQQLADGRFVVGGCRDVEPDQGRATQAVPTEPVQQAIELVLRDILGVRAPITHRWAGLVGFTPDDLPIAEQVRPGVFAAGGYSGTGNVLGKLAGEAIADLARGAPIPELVRLLDQARATGA